MLITVLSKGFIILPDASTFDYPQLPYSHLALLSARFMTSYDDMALKAELILMELYRMQLQLLDDGCLTTYIHPSSLDYDCETHSPRQNQHGTFPI